MPIEIEKKYRLTAKQREAVRKRLNEIGVVSRPEEFEENTLYQGGILDVRACVLRLRRVAGRSFGVMSVPRHRLREADKDYGREAICIKYRIDTR